MAKQELEKIDENLALERPEWIKTGDTGTEHITKDDLRLPRLALAQGLSPQINDPSSPKFIEGLRQGDMFNDLTSEIYGRGPMNFMIVRSDPSRYVEFFPRESGGGVKDLNVPANDPRTRFSVDPVTGQSLKPIATRFYDYIILLYPFDHANPMKNMIALSFKSSGLKTARELNSLIKMRNADLWTGVYQLTSATEKNSKGTFAVFQVKNAGWPKNPADVEVAKQIFDSIKDKKFEIAREPGDDDTTSFNPPSEDPHQM
jgi:hypothetical protein